MSIFSKLRLLKKDAASSLTNTKQPSMVAPTTGSAAIALKARLNEANALHQTGQLADAQAMYEDILLIEPVHADALYYLGVIALQANDPHRAIHLISQAIAINPVNYGYFMNQGSAQQQLNQLEAALSSFDKAIALRPEIPDAHAMRGNTLQALRHFDAAIASFDKALTIEPNNLAVLYNRSNAHLQMGRLEAAIASLDSAIAIQPDFAAAYFHRGVCLQELQQLDAAIASYNTTITLQADYAEAYANRGVAQHVQGDLDAALASYDTAIRLNPTHAANHLNRGLTLHALERWDAALTSFDTALTLQADLSITYCSRGRTLMACDRLDAALASFENAIKFNSAYADAHFNRGVVLLRLGRPSASESSFRQAVLHNPKLAQAHHNLASTLQTRGDIVGAQASYRKALECDPNREESHTGLLYCLSSDVNVTAEALFEAHLRFGDQFEAPFRGQRTPHANSPEPDRALNVGIVSGDLYHHAIATFIEPLLQELSGSAVYSLHAYYNNTVNDAVNRRLKRYFSKWSDVAAMDDEALAQKIRADGIDILIDLSGHTALNRLPTFARKPAPIQITWMGFPGTTGLQAMDYYLTDRHCFPPGQFDHLFTEKLVYLPGSAPFLPHSEAPDVKALPALHNGYLTFGSFNKIKKFSPDVVALWAQVLRAQPNARMVIGGMELADSATVTEWFAAEGIDGERLQFFPVSDMKTYLGLHHYVDICLDTFPYNGGTTTMQALWMGVPTLTLSGPTPVSRTGSSILGQLGLQSFQAHTHQEFVDIGLNWANRVEELSNIRSSLRTRIRSSPVGQPAVIAAGLENAMRTMWRRWCKQLAPETFGEM